jgi:N-acetylglucosamine malate deacetylase 2
MMQLVPSLQHGSASGVLDRWCDGDARQLPRVLVVAAHPDDDVLGLGGQLERVAAELHVAFVSDGAPDGPAYYRSLGFARRCDYAEARRAEAGAALELARVPEHHVHELGLVDQTLARQLDAAIARIARLIAAVAPDGIMTHPYEGGHPDHDATACAVHAAAFGLARAGERCPALLEFASYHARGESLAWGEFIPHPGVHTRQLTLDDHARRRKRALLSCHATQAHVWRDFPLGCERFRVAPQYDFRQPPAAPFHYDRVDWGTTGHSFLELVRGCFAARGIAGRI